MPHVNILANTATLEHGIESAKQSVERFSKSKAKRIDMQKNEDTPHGTGLKDSRDEIIRIIAEQYGIPANLLRHEMQGQSIAVYVEEGLDAAGTRQSIEQQTREITEAIIAKAQTIQQQFKDQTGKPRKLREVKLQPHRNPVHQGRNERCRCGSGQKFKHCCMVAKDEPVLLEPDDDRFSTIPKVTYSAAIHEPQRG